MDLRSLAQQICQEITRVLSAVDEQAVRRTVEAIVRARRVFVTGVGRSGHVARCIASRLTHLGLTAHMVGDPTTPAIGAGDVLLTCSGSGKTPGILSHALTARQAGATIIALTAGSQSHLAERSDITIVLPAPTPKNADVEHAGSIQPMGSLFEQALLIFGDALIMMLADRLNQSHLQMWQRHTNLE